MMDEEKQKKLEQKQASQSLEKETSYIPASNGENPGSHNNGEIN
jgi:hypothetical protein